MRLGRSKLRRTRIGDGRPMEYEGELARWCPGKNYDFADCYAVAVSGAGINKCGHMILNLGGCGPDAMYFHVTGNPYGHGLKKMYGAPLQMNQGGFNRYMS